MAFIRENLEQLRKDAQDGLTNLDEQEKEFLDQAIKGVEDAEM